MLIRHIAAKPGARARVRHAIDLADYIFNPSPRTVTTAGADGIGHRAGHVERVVHAGSHGFTFEGHEAQIAELAALAHQAKRSGNPIRHYVIAWSPGEEPSHCQVDEAVDMLRDGLGYRGLQILYARHADRLHHHVHVIVNRVDPTTLRMRKPAGGFEHLALQKIAAQIAHAQGWSLPNGALFRVDEKTSQLVDQRAAQRETRCVSARAAAAEQNTGEVSIQRLAQEQAWLLIQAARSWQDLHQRLAAAGWVYRLHRGGAVLSFGEVRIKASSAARAASLAALERRLGPFILGRDDVVLAPPAPMLIEGGADPRRIAEYQRARRARNQAARTAMAQLRRRHHDERRQLAEGYHERRRSTNLASAPAGFWRGRRAEMNATASFLAREHAVALATLRERHRRERADHAERFPPWPPLAEWLEFNGDEAAAAAHRHRRAQRRRKIEAELFGPPGGNMTTVPPEKDIRDYVAAADGVAVEYREAAGLLRRVAFIDHGNSVRVLLNRDPDAVLAALQLASAKFGGQVRITGHVEFQRLATRLAAQHGIRILNEDSNLRLLYAAERAQALELERDQDRESSPLPPALAPIVNAPPAPARVPPSPVPPPVDLPAVPASTPRGVARQKIPTLILAEPSAALRAAGVPDPFQLFMSPRGRECAPALPLRDGIEERATAAVQTLSDLALEARLVNANEAVTQQAGVVHEYQREEHDRIEFCRRLLLADCRRRGLQPTDISAKPLLSELGRSYEAALMRDIERAMAQPPTKPEYPSRARGRGPER